MLTEDLPTLGVDGNDAIPLRLEISRNDMCGLVLVGCGSHDRDRLRLLVDAQEVLTRWAFRGSRLWHSGGIHQIPTLIVCHAQSVARRRAGRIVRKHGFWPVPSYGLGLELARIGSDDARWKADTRCSI